MVTWTGELVEGLHFVEMRGRAGARGKEGQIVTQMAGQRKEGRSRVWNVWERFFLEGERDTGSLKTQTVLR